MYERAAPFASLPRTPPAVKWLLIANAAVFLLQYFFLPFLLQPFGVGMERTEGLFTRLFGLTPDLAVRHGWLWQFGTYMFLHGGFTHILFNMLVLWMMGGELERAWGWKAFLRYYLVTGVGAGLSQLLTPWGITAVGASGAVYGVLVAFAVLYPRRKLFLLFLPIPIEARILVPILILVELAASAQGNDGVAHLAHVGGALVGWLYLKRAWRIGDWLRTLRWRLERRRYRVVEPPDEGPDRWVH